MTYKGYVLKVILFSVISDVWVVNRNTVLVIFKITRMRICWAIGVLHD